MPKPEVCLMYFAHSACWHARTMAAHFADIKAMGADSVVLQFLENDQPRALRFAARLAQEARLKAYGTPGRIAGLFAAGPRPGSMFALTHLEAVMRTRDGQPVVGISGVVCCVHAPAFIAWYYPRMEAMLLESGVDGVFFDEPKEIDYGCWCPHCRERVSEETPAAMHALREEGMAAMMGRVSTAMKGHRPDFAAIAMLLPDSGDHFVAEVCAQPAVTAVGCDGPLCSQGPDPNPTWIKTPIWESAPRIHAATRAAGKGAFMLAETFDVPPSACPELAANAPPASSPSPPTSMPSTTTATTARNRNR